jgi:hypothetical protein
LDREKVEGWNMGKITMSEYTPTTEEVSSGYSNHFETVRGVIRHRFPIDEDGREAFDRWLASVKADAWAEGAYAALEEEGYECIKFDFVSETNPYRGEQA